MAQPISMIHTNSVAVHCIYSTINLLINNYCKHTRMYVCMCVNNQWTNEYFIIRCMHVYRPCSIDMMAVLISCSSVTGWTLRIDFRTTSSRSIRFSARSSSLPDARFFFCLTQRWSKTKAYLWEKHTETVLKTTGVERTGQTGADKMVYG